MTVRTHPAHDSSDSKQAVIIHEAIDGAKATDASDALAHAKEAEALERLSRAVISQARTRGVTIACAESLTAGMLASSLAGVSGASQVLLGGCVSYACAVKHKVLRVSAEILDDPHQGPVSSYCSQQMALGAKQLMESDIAVSLTGIAGPTGALPGKPIGTVWICLAHQSGFICRCFHFSGDRTSVRMQATRAALHMISTYLESL